MLLKLTMTCGVYDRSQALIEKLVRPKGIELEIHANSDDRSRQSQARKGAFDIAEFYTGLYVADLPYNTLRFTAIPIFVKRMFRHSYIYVNRLKGIRAPIDLNGKRVGIQTWFTTTALWARGILEEQFGVDLKSITWVADRNETIGEWRPPPWLNLEIAPPSTSQFDLLAQGYTDASITTGAWAPALHPNIDFLFPNHAQVEREYFKQTGFFPIMHTLVIKTAVLEKHPWVAMSIFNAWEASKQHCYRWLERQRIHLTSMWFRALWEEERLLAGPDIYPWGFQKSHREVGKVLEYAYRQGITPRKYEAEEMFHPSTLQT